MSASVKFVLGLLVCTAFAALASGVVLHRQSTQQTRAMAEQMTGGDSEMGKLLMTRYGCTSCHEASGIMSARGVVGPSLSGIASRSLIAGKLTNTPDHMILWLRVPQRVSPGSGMPDLGVSERDAKDLAAYLYTLDTTEPDK